MKKRRVVVAIRRRKGQKKSYPITKSVDELNRKKVITKAHNYKNISPKGPFRFEPTDYLWKDGKTREVGRIRIQSQSDGTIIHLRIEHLVPVQQGDVFYKGRTGMEVGNEHITILGVPTFKEYFLISESFTQPRSADALGGFQSGRIWEVANKQGLLDALEQYRQKGWKQVPYAQIRGGGTLTRSVLIRRALL